MSDYRYDHSAKGHARRERYNAARRERRAASYAARTPEDWAYIDDRRRTSTTVAREAWAALRDNDVLARITWQSRISLALRERGADELQARLVEEGVL